MLEMTDYKWRNRFSGFLDRRRLKHVEQAPDPEHVERFLRKRVPSFQKSPPGPMLYDNRERAFKPEEDGAIDDLEHLIAAHDEESKPEMQVYSCSWEKVFDLMSEASATHKPSIYSNPALSIGGDLASRYIDLIPDEYGLGMLKGGLALIFEALQKKEENAQKILEVFETVPETILTINTAYALLDPEPDDEHIKRDFYDTLVRDVPVLIAILRGSEPWYKKVAQFLALRIPETMSISGILERWSKKLGSLKGHVDRMNIRILGSLNSKMNSISDVGTQVQAAETNIRTLLLTNSSLQYALMGKFHGHITKQNSEIWHQQKLAACAMTGLYDEIRELTRQVSESRRIQEKKPQRRPQAALVTPIQLLGIIAVPGHTAQDDLEIVLRQARSFDLEMHARVGWLTKTAEFRDWLRTKHSSLLLVDGCLPGHNDLITPMSGFCAALVSSLVESEHHTVLFFFTGEHCDMQSPDRDGNGPKGLMMSLISQLLLSSALVRPDLGFLTSEYLEDLGRYDFRALCSLFETLVQQLPPISQIYCIIDGISWYEQSLWLEDVEFAAAMFEYLMKEQRESRGQLAPVKLLMTSPGKSIELVKRSWDRESVWKHVSLASGHTITGVPHFRA
ncbi:hypothetical protein F5Y10DRAFT_235265 [Nemania abortiva]|nr:hypothetical protein F5Y10DRAFT_235265 [Nemania abortiva]